jgi:hypothetical protein
MATHKQTSRPTNAQIHKALLTLERLQAWTNGYNNDAVNGYVQYAGNAEHPQSSDETLIFARTACETIAEIRRKTT